MLYYTVKSFRTGLADSMVTLALGEPGDGQVLKNVNFAYRIHPAAQSDIGKQQWVTGFHCVWSIVVWLLVYQDGDYLYPGQYSQTIC